MPELKVTAFSATEGVRHRGHADFAASLARIFPSRGVICVPRASKRRDPHRDHCSVSGIGNPQTLAMKRPRCDGSASGFSVQTVVQRLARSCSGPASVRKTGLSSQPAFSLHC